MIHHRLRSKSSRNSPEQGTGTGTGAGLGTERTLSDLKEPKERRQRQQRRRGGGNCYAFRGQEGNVTVLFHSPVLVTAIQLYHPKEAFQCPDLPSTKGAGASTGANTGANTATGSGSGDGGGDGSAGKGGSSAPRVFRVYGWTTDPTSSSSSINPLATHLDKGSGGVQGMREPPTLLGTFEFLDPCSMTQPQSQVVV